MNKLKYLVAGLCSVGMLALAVPALAENWTLQGNDIYNNNSGYVGIGTTSPTGELNVVSSSTDGLRGVSSYQYINGVNAAVINLAKARGTSSAPLTVANGDILGNIQFIGFGTTFVGHAAIKSIVNGTVTGNTVPTDLFFMTGSSSVVEAMRISSSGNVGINTISPNEKLEVNGNVKISGNLVSDGDICIGTCP